MCTTLAQDCNIRVVQCQTTINGLLTDLEELINDDDFQELKEELLRSFITAVDKLYAQMILTCNTSRATPTTQDRRSETSKAAPPPNKSKNSRVGTRGIPEDQRTTNDNGHPIKAGSARKPLATRLGGTPMLHPKSRISPAN